MKTYKIRIADYSKLMRAVLIYISIIGAILLTLWISLGVNNTHIEPKYFMIGMIILSTVIPFLLIIIMKFNASKKGVTLEAEKIKSHKYGSIEYTEIEKVSMPYSLQGTNSLIILWLKDGKRYSLSVINRFSGIDNHEFLSFQNAFITLLKRSRQEN